MFGTEIPGAGTDSMSQMIQMATMATKDPDGFAKIMAATGKAPPPIPVKVEPLADITPKANSNQLPNPTPSQVQPQAQAQPQGAAPMLPGIPMQQPVVTGSNIQAAAPPLTAANVASGGMDIGALMQAMGGLQVPQQPQQQQPQLVSGAPIRPGGQIDPAIMQKLIALMSGAQGQAPAGGSGLGAMISGRR